MLARVLSAALSRQSARRATADVNGIEAFPVEVEVNSGWGDTVVVVIMPNSPILRFEHLSRGTTTTLKVRSPLIGERI
jgi:hypothetical protein